MNILRLLKTLSFPVILILTGASYPQTGNVYQISIKDENNEIGQYFDIQIDSIAITSDTALNFQMIPNLDIGKSLSKKYSSFLELLMRVTNTAEVVSDPSLLVRPHSRQWHKWNSPVNYQVIVPNYDRHVGKIDSVAEYLAALTNSLRFVKNENNFGQSPKLAQGWNFDYRFGGNHTLFDLPIDVITRQTFNEFSNNRPKNMDFDIITSINFTPDINYRIAESFLRGLLVNGYAEKDLITPNGRLTELGDNVVTTLYNLSQGYDFSNVKSAINGQRVNRTPFARFSLPKEGFAMQDINLVSQASDVDGTIAQYLWLARNGDPADASFQVLNPNSANAVFRANYLGNYEILHIVQDNEGLQDTTRHSILLYEPGGSPIEWRGVSMGGAWDPSSSFDQVRRHFNYIKNEMNANYVSFQPTWFVSDTSSNVIRPVDDGVMSVRGTMPDDTLEAYIQMAIDEGLNVMLRPGLRVDNFKTAPDSVGKHQMIRPRREFFEGEQGYDNFIIHYAKMAEKYRGSYGEPGVKILSVQAEMDRLTESDGAEFWRAQADTLRKIYKGLLTSSIFDSELKTAAEEVPWEIYDIISSGAYFPLATSTDASTLDMYSTLLDIINNDVKPVVDQFGKPFMFAEIGYPNRVDGAVYRPAKDFLPFTEVERDDEVQRRAIDAVLRNLDDLYRNNQDWFKGMFLWSWIPWNDGAEQNVFNNFAKNKIRHPPVEHIVKAHYKK